MFPFEQFFHGYLYMSRGIIMFFVIIILPLCQADLKNLHSLEICGGGLTDAGVKNIKDLASLKLLNLSQNYNLTDRTLEMLSGMFCLVPFTMWGLTTVFTSKISLHA